jgi:hypothetical protein
VELHSLADIPASTEQVPPCCIVVRQVDNKMACLGANLGVITGFVRGAESSDMRTQAVITPATHAVQPSPPDPARRNACDQRQATRGHAAPLSVPCQGNDGKVHSRPSKLLAFLP